MKKTVLIPTDFSVESLAMLKALLASAPEGSRYDIVLLHGICLEDSVVDLLFFSKGKIMNELSNQEFEQALHIIKSKYSSKINSVRHDLFTGFNQSAFNNYLEATRVEEIYLISNLAPRKAAKRSFDLTPFILRSGLKVTSVEANTVHQMPEKGRVAEIFFNEVSLS